MTVRAYSDLKLWQKAMQLAEDVCRAAELFPSHQRYVMGAQIQRAAISIPSNVAEGYGRLSDKELMRFLNIAAGSLCELQTQITLSHKLGFLSESNSQTLYDQSTEVMKMIHGLRSCIANHIDGFAEASMPIYVSEEIQELTANS